MYKRSKTWFYYSNVKSDNSEIFTFDHAECNYIKEHFFVSNRDHNFPNSVFELNKIMCNKI